MSEAIRGRGEIRQGDNTLCRVSYQLHRPEPEEEDAPRFTLTDGVIEVEQAPDSDDIVDLEPGQELTLFLEEPLRDGRKTLTLVVEPYAGHRPDERYQVSIKEGSDWS